MKKISSVLLSALMVLSVLSSCYAKDFINAPANPASSQTASLSSPERQDEEKRVENTASLYPDAVMIALSDEEITVDGKKVSSDPDAPVYTANDIIFYLAGQGFTYGEGEKEDEHEQPEADKHTVLHITEPGKYLISGTLSAGQIAIDLGKDAKDDPDAVVTLILDGIDITCSVAPSVIFYNVYECGSTDEESAIHNVDTSSAGANVIIADGSINNVNGSYVARIYKSYTLSEDGTKVVDNKKLHKYDAAFYSKMSMNITGGEKGDGILNINAENEGLDSELHLTVNGGNIRIVSGNDGINTNEDNVSVTTVNGGLLDIQVTGKTGEGDGIDSNGWLVINGGTVISSACSFSADAGIDSDKGIHINGGNVYATGNMLDHIAENKIPYVVFTFSDRQLGGSTYTLKDSSGIPVAELSPKNDFHYLIVSGFGIGEGTYSLWNGDTQYAGIKSENGFERFPGFGGMSPGGNTFMPPEGFDPENMSLPELPDDFFAGEMVSPDMPNGFSPDGIGHSNMPDGMRRPGENRENRENADRFKGFDGNGNQPGAFILSTEFEVTLNGSIFNNVSPIKTVTTSK